jgi:hypothetical protein
MRSPTKGLSAQSRGPTQFLLAGDASTPLPVDEVREPAGPGRYYSRTIVWSFGRDGRFRGPSPVTTFQVDGTDGQVNYLSTHQQLPPEKGAALGGWDSRFYYVENGGEPRRISLPAPGPHTQYILTRRATPGNGPIITTSTPQPGKADLQQQWLVRGGHMEPIPQWLASPQYRFDRWGLSVGTEADQVHLQDLRTGSHIDIEVRRTDDIGGIESVNVDRYGWLFVENEGSDYAIKWHHGRSGIDVDRVVRFTGRGFWSRFFAGLTGVDRGMRVDETHWSAQCVDFSPALQLTLFCKPAKVLRDGHLERIGHGSSTFDRYVGDATGLRVALLRGTDGELYAYNGEDVQSLGSKAGRFPLVQDLPTTGRTFVTSGASSWEIVGQFPRLRLRAIRFSGQAAPFACCLSLHGMSYARFVPFPHTTDVIAFSTLLGAWRLDRDRATFLWPTQGSEIDLKSIASAEIWGGLVFSTSNKRNYVLKNCAS